MRRRLRRRTLWVGCTLLTVAFVATEELVRGADEARFANHPGLDFLSLGDAEPGLSSDNALDAEAAPAAPLFVELSEFLGRGPADSARQDAGRRAVAEAGDPPRKKPAARSRRAEARRPAPDLRRVHRVTAYCDRGLTAAGVPSGVGQCAAPADIPFGSRVYIPALRRSFIVTDRTHERFRRNTVDLFLPSEWSCRQFGRQYLVCEFTRAERPAEYGKLRVK